jgi:restriction system protein
MAEISSVPTFDELMWPTLQALKAKDGSATNEELLSKVIEVAAIAPEVQAVQHVDHRQSRLNYNLAWAKTYLKKVGAIDNSSRGVWSITKSGETLTESDVHSVPSRVRKQISDNKHQQVVEPTSPEEDAPGSENGEGVGADEPYWKDQLHGILREMTPASFERLAQRLLREAGFVKVEVTGRSGDGGIDGIGVLRVNLKYFFNVNAIRAASVLVLSATSVARW